MSDGSIYIVHDNGELTPLTPSAPSNEDAMQALVAKHPELITDGDGDLLLVRREQPIADSGETAGRWSLDHLFVTRAGVPVLVELKRASDTRIRREVVGQMLDYAANATAYWKAGQIAEACASTLAASGVDAETALSDFLEGTDPDEFWQRVDANFAAGRVKLVFVADVIPRELARIIEFMNDQMRADVRGVELRWFENPDRKLLTLSPKVIGETQRSRAIKAVARGNLPPISADEWIEAKLSPFGTSAIEAARQFLVMVQDLGGQTSVPNTQGSVCGEFRRRGVRMLYPVFLVRTGGGQVQLGLGYLKSWEAFRSDEARQALLDELTSIVGPMTKRPLNGFPAFPVTVLNDPEKRLAIRAFFDRLIDLSCA